MFTNHDVSRYYDLSEVHYRLFWQLEKSRSLHYGIWDQTTRNFHDALLNTNKLLAKKGDINKDHHVLDAGCGVGGSSIWLAGEIGCTVRGITLSARQVQKARSFAEKAGVQGHVDFEQKDYTATGYPDETFDVVIAVESVCHAPDKNLFLKEAFRVLKKGGRLVVADFFQQKDLKGKPAEMVTAFAHSWAVNDFSVWEEFQEQLAKAGFRNNKADDYSQAVLPSARRLYRAYLMGKPMAVLYRIFRGKPTSLASNNVESARLQYITLKKGWWNYKIVTAEKA
jgi:cyclopropane fatty-acyl-phospholipid synthase-like methyltransferase